MEQLLRLLGPFTPRSVDAMRGIAGALPVTPVRPCVIRHTEGDCIHTYQMPRASQEATPWDAECGWHSKHGADL
jgi:hypothetical protein